MVESKFWCVFVKIVITQKQIRCHTCVYKDNVHNLMYISGTNNTGKNSIYIVFFENIQRNFFTKRTMK